MRVGLIGDVHGEDDALAAVLAFLVPQKLDALLCTGDLPGKQGMGDTARCCDLLQENGVLTIRGNHDRWAIESATDPFVRDLLGDSGLSPETLVFLQTLPPTRTLPTPLGDLLLCHGTPRSDMDGVYPGGDVAAVAALLPPEVAIVVAGHTHFRMARTVGAALWLNPGTLLYDHTPGFLIADLAERTVTAYTLTPFTNEITKYGILTP